VPHAKKVAPQPRTVSPTTETNTAERRSTTALAPKTERATREDRFFAARRVRSDLDVLTVETAKTLQRVRREHVAAGHHGCTREALAQKLDINDKQIFQYEDASKRAPLAILASPEISADFREDIADAVLSLARESSTDRRAVVALTNAVERAEEYARAAALGQEGREALAATLRRLARQLSKCADDMEEP
jgi:hypothetical protein